MIDAVVVAYRSLPVLESCLTGLLTAGGAANVIVVDNSSELGAKRLCQGLGANGGRVVYDDPGINLGFGRAVNRGATLSAAPYIAVLNADVSVCRPLDQLVDVVEHYGAAVVAGRMLRGDGTVGVNARAAVSPSRELLRALIGSQRTAPVTPAAHTAPVRVPQLDGALLLMRRSTFDTVGGFDERFELYYEDVDLCRRLEPLGGCMLTPNVVATHHGGSSSSQVVKLAYRALRISRVRFLRKHYGPAGVLAAVGAAFLELVSRGVTRQPEGFATRARTVGAQLREVARPGSEQVFGASHQGCAPC